MYDMCKTMVLKGTHTQCMRFVNICYRSDAMYEVCKTWVLIVPELARGHCLYTSRLCMRCKMSVLKGTHVQCMRFVNVCYRRDTVYEPCKTWVLKETDTMYEVCKFL